MNFRAAAVCYSFLRSSDKCRFVLLAGFDNSSRFILTGGISYFLLFLASPINPPIEHHQGGGYARASPAYPSGARRGGRSPHRRRPGPARLLRGRRVLEGKGVDRDGSQKAVVDDG